MYFDEDGDLAHEFYWEERVTSPSGVGRWRMKQIFNRLRPQVSKNVVTSFSVAVAVDKKAKILCGQLSNRCTTCRRFD